jgi:hypothetical protein
MLLAINIVVASYYCLQVYDCDVKDVFSKTVQHIRLGENHMLTSLLEDRVLFCQAYYSDHEKAKYFQRLQKRQSILTSM